MAVGIAGASPSRRAARGWPKRKPNRTGSPGSSSTCNACHGGVILARLWRLQCLTPTQGKRWWSTSQENSMSWKSRSTWLRSPLRYGMQATAVWTALATTPAPTTPRPTPGSRTSKAASLSARPASPTHSWDDGARGQGRRHGARLRLGGGIPGTSGDQYAGACSPSPRPKSSWKLAAAPRLRMQLQSRGGLRHGSCEVVSCATKATSAGTWR